MFNRSSQSSLYLICLWMSLAGVALAQPQVTPWGNIDGIRVDGQLMEFESRIRAVGIGEATVLQTAKERQNPSFSSEEGRWVVTTQLDSLDIRQQVSALDRGRARIDLELTARSDLDPEGVYFSIVLPTDLGGGGQVWLVEPENDEFAMRRPMHGVSLRGQAMGARVEAPHRYVEVGFEDPTEVVVGTLDGGRGEVNVLLASGPMSRGETLRRSLTLTATGEIDHRPVELHLDVSRPERSFDGLGGNFRLQNPQTDPPVIEYNLENLRVAWGRVEMPWRFWHPDEDVDPLEAARGGDIHPRAAAAMEMAQELDRRGIPVMLAAWSGPDWAIEGPFSPGGQPYGLRGNALDGSKSAQIYRSIGSFVQHMQEAYGVETVAFSFNESDLGINIRQTPTEHARLIRELGAHFEERGLPTKLLLGDTADANGFAFTYEAVSDPSTHPYIFAVSFHSWRGWADETLREWADIADRLDIPLVVGEGSTDAAAWRYPEVFEETVYVMEEIELYTRILSICRPRSILQWQLTADYSLLVGGGVFGNDDEPLRPTQRFFNMQQLSLTPEGLSYLPIESSRTDVTVAALGDDATDTYAIHIVNNGAARDAILTGLPDDLSQLYVYVTDEERRVEEEARVPVHNGEAQFALTPASFTTIMTVPVTRPDEQ
ncbi:MAG: hypothetical protein ACOCTG_06480 [Bacteroidota bacterium]